LLVSEKLFIRRTDTFRHSALNVNQNVECRIMSQNLRVNEKLEIMNNLKMWGINTLCLIDIKVRKRGYNVALDML
jgi:hypothetical protein